MVYYTTPNFILLQYTGETKTNETILILLTTEETSQFCVKSKTGSHQDSAGRCLGKVTLLSSDGI